MIPKPAEALIASIIPVLRVQLCESVASEFSDGDVKNKAAIGKRPFIEVAGINQGIFHSLLPVEFDHRPKLVQAPPSSYALDHWGTVLLQVHFLDVYVPK